jgi:hypothetical protein
MSAGHTDFKPMFRHFFAGVPQLFNHLGYTQMVSGALFKGKLAIFAQQSAVDVTHVVTNDIILRSSTLYENQSNITGIDGYAP